METMKLVWLCLMFGQIGLYLILRFWIKGNNPVYRRIVKALSWAGLGVWFLFRWVPSEFLTFHPLGFLLALPTAYLLYLLSLWVVGTRMSKENLVPRISHRLRGGPWKSFVRESSLNVLSSTYEELLYRWFFQSVIYELSGSAVVAIVVTAALFFLVHVNFEIAIVQMVDILLFSIAITLYYQWSINPIPCMIIHIVRNQLIISQKYSQAFHDQQKMAKYMRLLQDRNDRTESVSQKDDSRQAIP